MDKKKGKLFVVLENIYALK